MSWQKCYAKHRIKFQWPKVQTVNTEKYLQLNDNKCNLDVNI